MRRHLPLIAFFALLCLQLTATVALGHDCSSQSDCEETAGYNGAIAIIGGVIAIIAGILGTSLGGPATTEAEPPADTTEAPGTPGATAPQPTNDAGPATEPPSTEPPSAEPPSTEPPSVTPSTTGTTVPPIAAGPSADAPPGPTPSDTTKPAAPPADGDRPGPSPDDTTPPDDATPLATGTGRKPAPVDSGKPPLQEPLENISSIAGTIKDAVDKTKETIDKLPISDDGKEKIKGGLDKIGGRAGDVKDAADKANEYVKALDENLQKTGKLGISDDSQNFLGWWRVTFKGIGEVTGKFIDTVTAPVTGFIKKVTGKDAEKALQQAVPIKEFGDELSKLPTSAAQHVIKASNRDQISDAGQAWHGKEPDPDDLESIYPKAWPPPK